LVGLGTLGVARHVFSPLLGLGTLGVALHAFFPVKPRPSKSLAGQRNFCLFLDLMKVCRKYSTDHVIERLVN